MRVILADIISTGGGAAIAVAIIGLVPFVWNKVEDRRRERAQWARDAEQARRQQEIERIARDVKAELTKDSGNSTKDQTIKAADVSVETLEVAKAIRDSIGDLGAVKQELASFKREVSKRIDGLANTNGSVVIAVADIKTKVEHADAKVTAIEDKVADLDRRFEEHKRNNEEFRRRAQQEQSGDKPQP